MAQSVSDGAAVRYFCHQCDVDITPLPEFICPVCRSGFIEEVASDSESPRDVELISDDMDVEPQQQQAPRAAAVLGNQLSDILESIYGQFPIGTAATVAAAGGGVPPAGQSGRLDLNVSSGARAPPRPATRSTTNRPGLPPGGVPALEGIFQQILSSVAAPGSTVSFSTRQAPYAQPHAGHVNIEFPLFQVLHGHPGDYAWGSGGLDAVISQLLNQLDASGPAPMTKESIESVPFTEITKEDVERNLQCSVCMEDYKLGEPVRKLECTHVFHTSCIVPWLQMHATCPVCRTNLTPGQQNSGSDSNSSGRPPAAGSSNSSGGSSSGNSYSQYFDISDYD